MGGTTASSSSFRAQIRAKGNDMADTAIVHMHGTAEVTIVVVVVVVGTYKYINGVFTFA